MNTSLRSAAPRNARGLQAWPVAIALILVACGGDTADAMSDHVATEGGATTAIPTQQADACPLDVTPPP